MRNLLFLLTFSIVFLISSTVHAQSNKHLSTLGVDIWPEYDQPAVLTIYRITLAPNTVLPASLDLRLPSNAQINAVALVDPVKGLVNTPYDSSVQGKWSLLKVSTNFLQVQVEYYTPLVKNGSERHIVYEWAGDYAVDNLEVNFLRPFNADSVSISYTPVNTYPGQDGLTNYHIQKVDLATNQNFTLSIDYQRNTDDLSISSLPVQAASTPGPDTPGRVSMTGFLPWVLAGLGIVLIVAGIVGFSVWQRGGQRATNHRKQTQKHEENDDEFMYCHQCGKRAQPGDVFCRTCGTRLKRGIAD